MRVGENKLMILPPKAQPREKVLFISKTCTRIILVLLQSKDRGGRVAGSDLLGGANASGRDHAGPPFRYWRPGKGAGFPVAAALGHRVTLGGRVVTWHGSDYEQEEDEKNNRPRRRAEPDPQPP